jgi:hypothetical protein
MKRLLLFCLVPAAAAPLAFAAEDVMITGVPDFAWHAGCFGTAAGNMMAYWDRNGFPNFYTGPTGGGVAPLNSWGANFGIRSLWASQAGLDGRPLNQAGHIDDYWTSTGVSLDAIYESTAPDPWVVEHRPEHSPDCLSDFMGSSQNKWADFDGECSGNINAFSFNYWDKSGGLRVNFSPPLAGGEPVRDVQSGLRAWTHWRGYDADVCSQLVDFNPEVPPGKGFTFQDLKNEILRGNPVMLILQDPGEFHRELPGMPRANPNIHAMLAFHYLVTDDGYELVQFRTSWSNGDAAISWSPWAPQIWASEMALRGVILYRPLPKITSIQRADGKLSLKWDGPSSRLWDEVNQFESAASEYTVESAASVNGPFTEVSSEIEDREVTMDDPGAEQVFFRIKLTHPAIESAEAE